MAAINFMGNFARDVVALVDKLSTVGEFSFVFFFLCIARKVSKFKLDDKRIAVGLD